MPGSLFFCLLFAAESIMMYTERKRHIRTTIRSPAAEKHKRSDREESRITDCVSPAAGSRCRIKKNRTEGAAQ